jgi:hypothetical protein
MRPVVTYAVKDNIVQKFYGPTKLTDGSWRIKNNEELDNVIMGAAG